MTDKSKRIICLLKQSENDGKLSPASKSKSETSKHLAGSAKNDINNNLANLRLNLSYRDMSSVSVSSIDDLKDLNLNLSLSMSLEAGPQGEQKLLDEQIPVPINSALAERVHQFQSTDMPTAAMSEVTMQTSVGQLPVNGSCCGEMPSDANRSLATIFTDDCESKSIMFEIGRSESFRCPISSSTGQSGRK